jgi:RNA polymerase sigma factor (sigma-70 family)
MNLTDGELLKQYAHEHSETAFEELVSRHIHLVYSAALRQTSDSHQAEDIAQSVFADLARKAARLTRHPSVAGWLFSAVRLAAAVARRNRLRREHRERQAVNLMMNTTETETDWTRIRPFLDDTLCELDDEDREAVLLRHFEERSFAEIGQRFGLSENAARMRVTRALEKLHSALARRGVTSTGTALVTAIAANAVDVAPAGLAGKVLREGVAAAGVGRGAISTLLFSNFTVGTALTACVVILALALRGRHRTPDPVVPAAASNNLANVSPEISTSVKDAITTAAVTNILIPHHVKYTNATTLTLKIVTADSGQPIPMVPLDSTVWVKEKWFADGFVSDRFGNCEITYPSNVTELQLVTRKDAFADTQLLWHPPKGEMIPANYLLRLDRGVTIGGRVVDADGNPVAGAEVGWNHFDNPASLAVPQSHRFGWVTAITDNDGRWTLTRIADDMIPCIYGSANHPGYVSSPMVFARDLQNQTRNEQQLQQLRNGTAVFKMGPGATVEGIVVDEAGAPIAGAEVIVGPRLDMGARKGVTTRRGTFSVHGCDPGKPLVSAQKTGYSLATVRANFAAGEKVRLTLKPGRTLRLHVVDNAGNAIAGAWIGYDNSDNLERTSSVIAPEANFDDRANSRGDVVWKDAPLGQLKFVATSAGFFRTNITIDAAVSEQTITLSPSLIIHGTVTDAATGRAIPEFQIIEGGRLNGATNPIWTPPSRFWLNFTRGTYSNSFEEPAIGVSENPGFYLKVVADGYEPSISRFIESSEGNVELNFALQAATAGAAKEE